MSAGYQGSPRPTLFPSTPLGTGVCFPGWGRVDAWPWLSGVRCFGHLHQWLCEGVVAERIAKHSCHITSRSRCASSSGFSHQRDPPGRCFVCCPGGGPSERAAWEICLATAMLRALPGQFLECCMHVSKDMPVHSRPLEDRPAEHVLLSPASLKACQFGYLAGQSIA